MTALSAREAGEFRIAGDMPVVRLGFGAMRITGPGIWGEPEDRPEAIRVLRRLRGLAIDFIDTADSYGPAVSENLIAEMLHPYEGLTVATKGGLTRPGPDLWEPCGRPDYLRQCVMGSLSRLKVDRLDLWQLHRIDPKVPREDQFGVIADMLQEGLIRHAGLSQVSVEEIEAARQVFPVATVQNRYNLTDRADEEVVTYCETNSIGFIPWFPLAAGELARPGGPVDEIARAHGANASQVALAWMLERSPVMLPIPGTSRVSHLEDNVGGAAVKLTDEEFAALDSATRPSPR